MNKHPHISIVSPEYRGEKMVKELVDRIIASVSPITDDFEIILVNDASPDNTWSEIEKVCAQDKRVKGLNLSRNFGQHYAITAGLNYAKGDWVVVMDCDLQDRPEEIPNLYKKAQEGYDSVLAQRVHREHSWLKQLGSKSFYALFAYLTETKQDASIANFGIYNCKVVDAILAMGDKMRYFPAQVQWVGFKKAYLPIQHDVRAEGESTYNFSRLFKLALDTIISFSDKPMRLTVKIGAWMTIFSFIIAIIYIVRYFVGGIQVAGFTSLIISIWFLTGVIISLLGLVGLYIGKIFDTAKNRPTYIVSETKNCAE
ncbi:MAG: glycosyltransferase family 2 protein [Paludibacteraceae bacterium]|nr:glycosyltransferase family 2 protein [Paludibacteraceae bacterium]